MISILIGSGMVELRFILDGAVAPTSRSLIISIRMPKNTSHVWTTSVEGNLVFLQIEQNLR